MKTFLLRQLYGANAGHSNVEIFGIFKHVVENKLKCF